MRKAARAGDSAAVLRICDELRDAALPPLGVQLEDEGGAGGEAATGGAWVGKWKLRDAAELQREIADKARLAEERAAAKAAAAAAAASRAAEKEAKARVVPLEMFKAQTDLYSKFDDAGVPTHDAAGAELPSGTRKRLEKEHALQAKLHQTWLKKQQEQPRGSGGEPSADGAPDAE